MDRIHSVHRGACFGLFLRPQQVSRGTRSVFRWIPAPYFSESLHRASEVTVACVFQESFQCAFDCSRSMFRRSSQRVSADCRSVFRGYPQKISGANLHRGHTRRLVFRFVCCSFSSTSRFGSSDLLFPILFWEENWEEEVLERVAAVGLESLWWRKCMHKREGVDGFE